MTDTKRNADISGGERREMFHDSFDNDIDAGPTLANLLRATGDYLASIVGEDQAAKAMEVALAPLFQGAGSRGSIGWRARLDDAVNHCFSELPIGQRLHDLAAYAYYGISFAPEDDEDEAWLHATVAEIDAFIARSPLQLWLPENDAPQLERLALLARNRWALDTGRAVEPAALAVFGGVSEGRMRNMMSGAKRTFTPEDGRIPAAAALEWLAGRAEFWTSIWRDQHLPDQFERNSLPLDRPVFVPVARDESVFHPGLRRNGAYTVGPKGAEMHVVDFDHALLALQRMPGAYWRRPNDAGAWGVVRAVDWRRIDMSDLEALAAGAGC